MAIPAWTYSQLDSFESCAKKFYHIKVARDVVDPPNEQAMWGDRVHKAIEAYIKEDVELPKGMNHWKSIVDKLKFKPGDKLTEEKLAIDKSFLPVEWGQAYSRGIIDLLVVNGKTAIVVDWKTGKRKPTEQLELYAAYVFAKYPEVQVVHTAFVWLKVKKVDKDYFTRDTLSDIWKRFLPRIRRLELAYEKNSWPPSPSGLCNGWCPVKSCTFYKEK